LAWFFLVKPGVLGLPLLGILVSELSPPVFLGQSLGVIHLGGDICVLDALVALGEVREDLAGSISNIIRVDRNICGALAG